MIQFLTSTMPSSSSSSTFDAETINNTFYTLPCASMRARRASRATRHAGEIDLHDDDGRMNRRLRKWRRTRCGNARQTFFPLTPPPECGCGSHQFALARAFDGFREVFNLIKFVLLTYCTSISHARTHAQPHARKHTHTHRRVRHRMSNHARRHSMRYHRSRVCVMTRALSDTVAAAAEPRLSDFH